MNKLKALLLGATLTIVSASPLYAANTFTWASSAEIPTLDPHGTAVATAITIYSQIYEPLIRNIGGKGLFPALATEWKPIDRLQWRFTLRQNVKFHDGAPFTADDVVFSLNRVRAEGSDLREYLDMVRAVVKVDDTHVDIFTKDPVANLPTRMAMFPMMSKAWSIANGVEKPSKAMQGEQSYANFHADGTGPFKLSLRRLDDRTELVVNPDYWDKPKHNLDKLVFRPIKDASTRAAALMTGEVDLIDSVPVQDVERLSHDPKVTISKIGEWRNVYFGMDTMHDTLNGGAPGEKNPFKDIRVRKAIFQAIDAEAIKTRVMRGLSEPSALPIAAGVDGYNAADDKRPAYNPEEGKGLLAAAGYPNGFKVDLDCPNDRWVADAQICTAIVSMLARVGIQVNLIAQPSSLFYAKMFQKKSSFFMFAFGVLDGDGALFLSSVLQTDARFNFGFYSNPKVDDLIKRAIVEFDPAARTKMMQEAFATELDDVALIGLHRQMVVWGHTKKLKVVVTTNGILPIDLFRFD